MSIVAKKIMMGSGAVEEITDGYTAWYRADDVTRSGNNVTQWNDKSGNGIHMTRFNTSLSPQFVSSDSNFNSQPSIDFTAQTGSTTIRFGTAGAANSGTGRANTFTNGQDTFSIFAVFRNSSSQATNSYGYSQIIGDQQGYLHLSPQSTTLLQIGNGDLTQSGFSRDTTFASHAFNGATSGSANLTLKTTGLTTAVHGSNPTFSSIGAAMVIGGGSAASQYFRGHIAEVIVYPTALTGDDASKTEDYLADRYNLTW